MMREWFSHDHYPANCWGDPECVCVWRGGGCTGLSVTTNWAEHVASIVADRCFSIDPVRICRIEGVASVARCVWRWAGGGWVLPFQCAACCTALKNCRHLRGSPAQLRRHRTCVTIATAIVASAKRIAWESSVQRGVATDLLTLQLPLISLRLRSRCGAALLGRSSRGDRIDDHCQRCQRGVESGVWRVGSGEWGAGSGEFLGLCYLRPRFDCQAEICQFRSRALAAHSLSDIVLAYATCGMRHEACGKRQAVGGRLMRLPPAAVASPGESVNIIGQIDVAYSCLQIGQSAACSMQRAACSGAGSRKEEGGKHISISFHLFAQKAINKWQNPFHKRMKRLPQVVRQRAPLATTSSGTTIVTATALHAPSTFTLWRIYGYVKCTHTHSLCGNWTRNPVYLMSLSPSLFSYHSFSSPPPRTQLIQYDFRLYKPPVCYTRVFTVWQCF